MQAKHPLQVVHESPAISSSIRTIVSGSSIIDSYLNADMGWVEEQVEKANDGSTANDWYDRMALWCFLAAMEKKKKKFLRETPFESLFNDKKVTVSLDPINGYTILDRETYIGKEVTVVTTDDTSVYDRDSGAMTAGRGQVKETKKFVGDVALRDALPTSKQLFLFLADVFITHSDYLNNATLASITFPEKAIRIINAKQKVSAIKGDLPLKTYIAGLGDQVFDDLKTVAYAELLATKKEAFTKATECRDFNSSLNARLALTDSEKATGRLDTTINYVQIYQDYREQGVLGTKKQAFKLATNTTDQIFNNPEIIQALALSDDEKRDLVLTTPVATYMQIYQNFLDQLSAQKQAAFRQANGLVENDALFAAVAANRRIQAASAVSLTTQEMRDGQLSPINHQTMFNSILTSLQQAKATAFKVAVHVQNDQILTSPRIAAALAVMPAEWRADQGDATAAIQAYQALHTELSTAKKAAFRDATAVQGDEIFTHPTIAAAVTPTLDELVSGQLNHNAMANSAAVYEQVKTQLRNSKKTAFKTAAAVQDDRIFNHPTIATAVALTVEEARTGRLDNPAPNYLQIYTDLTTQLYQDKKQAFRGVTGVLNPTIEAALVLNATEKATGQLDPTVNTADHYQTIYQNYQNQLLADKKAAFSRATSVNDSRIFDHPTIVAAVRPTDQEVQTGLISTTAEAYMAAYNGLMAQLCNAKKLAFEAANKIPVAENNVNLKARIALTATELATGMLELNEAGYQQIYQNYKAQLLTDKERILTGAMPAVVVNDKLRLALAPNDVELSTGQVQLTPGDCPNIYATYEAALLEAKRKAFSEATEMHDPKIFASDKIAPVIALTSDERATGVLTEVNYKEVYENCKSSLQEDKEAIFIAETGITPFFFNRKIWAALQLTQNEKNTCQLDVAVAHAESLYTPSTFWQRPGGQVLKVAIGVLVGMAAGFILAMALGGLTGGVLETFGLSANGASAWLDAPAFLNAILDIFTGALKWAAAGVWIAAMTLSSVGAAAGVAIANRLGGEYDPDVATVADPLSASPEPPPEPTTPSAAVPDRGSIPVSSNIENLDVGTTSSLDM